MNKQYRQQEILCKRYKHHLVLNYLDGLPREICINLVGCFYPLHRRKSQSMFCSLHRRKSQEYASDIQIKSYLKAEFYASN